jgi:hypothetical protein
MSGLRYFDDFMLALINADRIIAKANKVYTDASAIHAQEMNANRGRISRLAMEVANEKAAALLILRSVI